jgi:hypothetical protein
MMLSRTFSKGLTGRRNDDSEDDAYDGDSAYELDSFEFECP